jgi:hypothetical protein
MEIKNYLNQPDISNILFFASKDSSPELLNSIRSQLLSLVSEDNFQFEAAERVDDLDLASQKYSTIFLTSLPSHLSQLPSSLTSKLYSSLKPNGQLFYLVDSSSVQNLGAVESDLKLIGFSSLNTQNISESSSNQVIISGTKPDYQVGATFSLKSKKPEDKSASVTSKMAQWTMADDDEVEDDDLLDEDDLVKPTLESLARNLFLYYSF